MCGRFALPLPPKSIADYYQTTNLIEFQSRYNIAPSEDVIAVVRNGGGDREMRSFRWGLVPFWADDPAIGNRLINARAETVAKKPAFRQAFARRRCLIPAAGFYEWKHGGGNKQPYYITCDDDEPMTFAGIWERWDKEGGSLETCAILTTAADSRMERIHDRMPLMLAGEMHDVWLAGGKGDVLREALAASGTVGLRMYPVGTYVNNPKNEGSRCTEAAET